MTAPFNPTAPDFLANPYPTYKRLRQENPIFYYEPWGKWVLTRYEDINGLLRDKRLGRVIQQVSNELAPADEANADFQAVQLGSLLEIEPPDHTRIKQIVHDVFTPRHVRELGQRISALTERLAADLLAKASREANLLTEFAEPIPVTVIADLLGVPEADRSNLLPWSKGIIGMFEPERTPAAELAANRAALEFSRYIRQLMDEKRRHPGDDLITRLTHVHDSDPELLGEGEVVANAILFLNAGHEAVVNVIGNGVYALLRHPEQLERLRNDLELIPSAVEEMMRFDTPLQFFERFVLEDITYQGFAWEKGTKLCLYYASANHDPEIFDTPEQFDIARQPNPHIAFGLGLHYCIGAPLARLELQSALKTLLTRLPDLALLTQEAQYEPKNVFRYLKELQVRY